MFDNAPQNLPVGGKNLMDNLKQAEDVPAAISPPPPKPRVVPSPPVPRSPQGEAGGIDDIFSDVKEAPAMPAAFRPSSGPAAATPASRAAEKMADTSSREATKGEGKTVVETPRQGFKKILITVAVIIIFAGVIAGGGYWAYNNFLQPKPLNPNLNLNVNVNTGLNVAPAPEVTQPAVQQPVVQPTLVDNDNDGLPDTQEEILGTNPLNPDTDDDGLFDGEEVNVYRSDPLNPDTDDDGYKDGAEVKAGYDPKGPGKLIRIPAGQ